MPTDRIEITKEAVYIKNSFFIIHEKHGRNENLAEFERNRRDKSVHYELKKDSQSFGPYLSIDKQSLLYIKNKTVENSQSGANKIVTIEEIKEEKADKQDFNGKQPIKSSHS